MIWTKICGNTRREDAQLAVALGADALGFIFAPSRRQVTPAQARSILQELPAPVETVGVFTTGTAGEIAAVVREAGLSAVQLHCPLGRELLRDVRGELGEELGEEVRILQVVSLDVDAAEPQRELERFRTALEDALAEPGLFAVLVDAARGQRSGGLGVPIDWHAAAASVKEARGSVQGGRGGALPHLVLAGGLRAENLREAVDALSPWGVDVVSGVEKSPGVKSRSKLKAFLEEARRLRASAG